MQGEGINFSALKKTPEYPLIQGKSAKKADASEDSARYVRDENESSSCSYYYSFSLSFLMSSLTVMPLI